MRFDASVVGRNGKRYFFDVVFMYGYVPNHDHAIILKW